MPRNNSNRKSNESTHQANPFNFSTTAFQTPMIPFQTPMTPFQTPVTPFQTPMTPFQTSMTAFQTPITSSQTSTTLIPKDFGTPSYYTGLATKIDTVTECIDFYRCVELAQRLTAILERFMEHYAPQMFNAFPVDPHKSQKPEGITIYVWSSMTLSQKLSPYEIKIILDELSENVKEKFILYDHPSTFSDQIKHDWEANFGWRFLETSNIRTAVPALISEYTQHQLALARPPGQLILVSGDGGYADIISHFAKIGGHVTVIATEKSLSARLRAVVHKVRVHGDVLVAAGRRLVAEAKKDQYGYWSAETFFAERGGLAEFARAVQGWIDGVRTRFASSFHFLPLKHRVGW